MRYIYDKYGYPLSKHINNAVQADITYIIMKPLEWIFLIVLYLFDVKPENRIATQYIGDKGKYGIKSLEEKIGQMIIVGIEGNKITERTKKIILKYKIGGVILYRKNFKNYDEMVCLIKELKKLNPS